MAGRNRDLLWALEDEPSAADTSILDLRQEFEAGVPLGELADKTGLPYKRLRQELAAAGAAIRAPESARAIRAAVPAPQRRRKLRPLDPDLIGKYEQGASIRDLAAERGCSYDAMRGALKAAGVTLRPLGAHSLRGNRAR